jgi:hypothetical protein
MAKNFQAYQKLNLFNRRRFKPGDYIVIAGGKLFRKGRELEKFLAQARKRYPKEVPLVAKVPQRGTFVFILHD